MQTTTDKVKIACIHDYILNENFVIIPTVPQLFIRISDGEGLRKAKHLLHVVT